MILSEAIDKYVRRRQACGFVFAAGQKVLYSFCNRVGNLSLNCVSGRDVQVFLDVLQLSGLLAGDVKESRNDNPTRDLQMASDRTRPHTLCGPVVSSLFALAARC